MIFYGHFWSSQVCVILGITDGMAAVLPRLLRLFVAEAWFCRVGARRFPRAGSAARAGLTVAAGRDGVRGRAGADT